MRSTRVRNIVATVLGVLAVLLLTVGLVGVWTRATVSSGERVASLVNDALDQPEVGAGLSQYLTDSIFTSVDVESVLTTALPDQLQRFAPVLVSGARTAVERGLEAALSEPATCKTSSPGWSSGPTPRRCGCCKVMDWPMASPSATAR